MGRQKRTAFSQRWLVYTHTISQTTKKRQRANICKQALTGNYGTVNEQQTVNTATYNAPEVRALHGWPLHSLLLVDCC
jgi:hypothetical protein